MAVIEHVVVLMLENRSFDHLFGFLPNADGVVGKNLSNRLDPSRPAGADNPEVPFGPEAPFAIERGQGPGHSFAATNLQVYADRDGPANGAAAAMSGFVKSYQGNLRADHVGTIGPEDLRVVMQGFKPEALPALNALAREFVLCDRWFSEVPGPTMPNRFYVHAATSAGYAHNEWHRTFELRTIYDALSDAGKTWAVYYSDDNEVAQFSPTNQRRENFKIYEESFVADAQAGRLPHYTFIIPRFAASGSNPSELANSMHAPNDVRPGDALVAEVYAAVRANDAAWARTLLVVTFDEHGGFYDHVVPPAAPSPDHIDSPPPGDHASFAPAFAFDRLGLRVPTLLVSPWVAKGKVCSDPLQHTSILATLRELFGVTETLTARDKAAPSFAGVLDLATPRTDAPRTLGAPVLPAAATLAVARPEHPANQPIDEVVKSLCEGWDRIGRTIDDGTSPPTRAPATQAEAHAFLRAQVMRLLAASATASSRPASARVSRVPQPAPAPAHAARVTAVAPPTRQYVLLPPRGLRAQGPTAGPGVAAFLGAMPHRMDAVAELRPAGALRAPIAMRVLDTMHRDGDGARLVELSDGSAAALRAAQPGLRLVPLVYYRTARVRRPTPVGGVQALAAAAGVGVTLTARTRGAATPVAGATVVAFTDFAARRGAQGVTGADGSVRLRLPAGTRVDRLYVYPGATPCWGLLRANVELVDGATLDLAPIDFTAADALRHFYGAAADDAGRGVKVGVLDTGVALAHPHLAVAGGQNTVVGEDPADYGDNGGEGHGTHVAGIIASRGAPPTGARGLAPAVTLMSYRVFGRDAEGASNYAIAKAIDAGADAGCDLLNLSLGGGAADDATRAAIEDARARGTVCVIASGNDSRQPVSFPASDDLALAVSAMGRRGTYPADAIQASDEQEPFGADAANFVAAFSNVGPELDLTAPGVGIVSTVPPATYTVMDGTSMACPAAVGRAAALLAQQAAVLGLPRDAPRADAIARAVLDAARVMGFGALYEGRGMLP